MSRRRVSSEQRNFARQPRGNQTALEDRLWHELRAKRLDGWRFKRQAPIENYIADFVCFEARLIVEVDGPLHERPEHRRRDAERDAVLQGQGFRALRFDQDIALGRMVEDIRQALRRPPLPAFG